MIIIGGECKPTVMKTNQKPKCWCRDPSKLCSNWQYCHETDGCLGSCPENPKTTKFECSCEGLVKCNSTQYCKDQACHEEPAHCTDFTFTGQEECVCRKNNEGTICKPGQMCLGDNCENIDLCDMEGKTVTNNKCYCNVTETLCNPGFICDDVQKKCIRKCPNFPNVNYNGDNCFCQTDLYCSHHEICSEDKCSPGCQALPSKESREECYCGRTRCETGDMCEHSSSTCWPDVDTCPG